MKYPVYIDVTDSRKIEIPLREVKRYLGYGRVEMTPEVAEVARKLVDETRKVMRPRACYTRLAVTFMDYPRMDFEFGTVESKNLWRNLSDGSLFDFTAPARTDSDKLTNPDGFGPSELTASDGSAPSEKTGSDTAHVSGSASECFLLAATIGPQIDVMIRRYARTSPSKSVILQAIGAAAIESYCDLLEVRMSSEAESDGLTLLPRFSPGYGDFSLQHQRDFFRVLDPPRRAGITLTDQLLMVPEKSVTAMIGLVKADTGARCQPDRDAAKSRCDTCTEKNCGYRIG